LGSLPWEVSLWEVCIYKLSSGKFAYIS